MTDNSLFRTTKEWGSKEFLNEVLEELVDDYDLRLVLEQLAEVCDQKAYHLAVHWQDYKGQQTWSYYRDRIDGLQYDLFQYTGV